MALRELLTVSEKHMIEEYIDEYASDYSRRTVDADYILREWASAKGQYLARVFSGKLILSKEISYKKSPDVLSNELWDKCCNQWSNGKDQAAYDFYRNFRRVMIEEPVYFDRNIEYCLDSLINTYALATNTYNYHDFELDLPNGKKLKVNKGARCTRIIGKIADAFNIEGYEAFRLAHSQVLNQKALKGELCLSIHPMDYMTMSDNECDWESCMSWINRGCYRQGTVEMMNSPMVVVAYLRAKNDMNVCGYTWNSKKWRELFIVTPDVICNVKGYPYRSDELAKTVMGWLKELVEGVGFSSYDAKPVQFDNGNRYNHPHKEDAFLTLSMYTNFMYNDFDCEHWVYFGSNIPEGRVDINYSGASECMTCGRTGIYLDDGEEENLCCEGCEPSYRCAECGDRIHGDDYYEVDGDIVCSYCYDEHTFEDTITGKLHMNYHRLRLSPFVMVDGKPRVFSEYYIDIHEELYNEDFIDKYFKNSGARAKYVSWHWSHYQCVDIADLNEEGAKLFDVPITEQGIKKFMKETWWCSCSDDGNIDISDIYLF